MKGVFLKGAEAETRDLGGGTKRRILAWNGEMMSVEVEFETGAVGAVHTHPHTQISYVLRGRFRYTVEDESFEMGPGDSVAVPGGAAHGTECLEAGTLLDVFAPAREDFLPAKEEAQ